MEESLPPHDEAAMVMGVLFALQGAAEYGALTGSGAGGGGRRGPAEIAAWAAEHQMVLLALAAGLFLLWMVTGSSHRR